MERVLKALLGAAAIIIAGVLGAAVAALLTYYALSVFGVSAQWKMFLSGIIAVGALLSVAGSGLVLAAKKGMF
jgi:hypothetical protein